ncbi:MAG TPA: hypothetical protein VGK86_07215 [Thermoanaerobaculia bacterium]
MRPLSPTRYFAVVSPPAAPLVAVLAILAAGAGVLEIVDRGSSDWIIASIGLVQLFACSTGFARHATRGYYDPVLLDAAHRRRAALAHFVVSSAPGVGAWIAAGAAQAIAAHSPVVPALRPAGWAGLFLVSSIPWAASVRGPRFLAGALWLTLTASLAVSGKLLVPLALLHSQSSWAGEHPLRALAVGLAFPVVLPSLDWPPAVLVGFSALGVAAVAAGIEMVAAAEFALAEEGG